ncbi:MAG TPA: excisionase family DNA-binding protein [Nitrospira sp.]|nr:excisionase family DNA-binding protein [Nitrospira sp.]
MQPLWMSAKQLAKALGMSLITVRRAYRSGEIPVERLGRAVRFDPFQVKEAMRKNARGFGPTGGMSRVEHRRAPGGASRPRAERLSPRLVKRGRNFPERPRR